MLSEDVLSKFQNMNDLRKVWREISDEASGANLAKWKKKRAFCISLKEWAPVAFMFCDAHALMYLTSLPMT